jgi:hypothetical protein
LRVRVRVRVRVRSLGLGLGDRSITGGWSSVRVSAQQCTGVADNLVAIVGGMGTWVKVRVRVRDMVRV